MENSPVLLKCYREACFLGFHGSLDTVKLSRSQSPRPLWPAVSWFRTRTRNYNWRILVSWCTSKFSEQLKINGKCMMLVKVNLCFQLRAKIIDFRVPLYILLSKQYRSNCGESKRDDNHRKQYVYFITKKKFLMAIPKITTCNTSTNWICDSKLPFDVTRRLAKLNFYVLFFSVLMVKWIIR